MEQSDAEQAYLQADFFEAGGDAGIETWVKIPKEFWPKHWHGKYRDPVVPLLKALYGHPDAGGLWERKCTRAVKRAGFEEVDNWPSLFYNKSRNVLLFIYVDDFKMAGPKSQLAAAWADLRRDLVLEDPHPVDRCLGCLHRESTAKLSDGTAVRLLWYDMTSSSSPAWRPG